MSNQRFAGQVAVVTGGSGGLGTALCSSLSKEGARVYACGLHKNNRAQSELHNIRMEQVDVRDVASLQSWIGRIAEAEGRIDLLVNAAGICPLLDWPDVTESIWDDVMNVNLKSVFFACQAALVPMIKEGRGTIVNVGSTAGYNGGVVTAPAYGPSKAGVHTLTKWLAAKTSSQGIRVNTVVPGPFKSAMTDAFTDEMRARLTGATPNGRMGTPEDVVQGILYLADWNASAHVTGAAIDICGGAYLR